MKSELLVFFIVKDDDVVGIWNLTDCCSTWWVEEQGFAFC